MEAVQTAKHTLYSEQHISAPHHPWIVFVHGAGGSVRTWKYQLDSFRKDFNLLVIDLRDHGNSQKMPPPRDGRYSFQLMARDVVQVLESRGIAAAHFVGVSMGSIVIRWVEHLFPHKVQSIVLAGGVFRLNLKLKWGIRLGILMARLFSFRVLSRLLSLLIMPRGNHQKARRVFLREADRIHPLAFKKWMGIARTIGKELEMFFRKKISVPTLVVMGGQDHVFLQPSRRYAEKNAKVRLQVIPGCGHVCNIEAADAFNDMALRFLRSVPAS